MVSEKTHRISSKILLPTLGLVVLVVSSSASLPDECEPVKQTGSKESSIDLLFVMGDYESDNEAYQHAEFYAGFEGTDRGLFDIYPMNVSQDRFNVWYVGGRQGSNTTEGNNGPFREARYQRKQCNAEYAVYMARNTHSWGTGAFDRVSRVKGIEQKVSRSSGAIGLIHEWGHMFGGLSDEYESQTGKKPSNRPNCAANISQAREWWGDMARESSSVGYERGCKNSEEMIEPHPGGTIMGDGGLRNYGPVNDRRMLKQIKTETKPITDISLTGINLDEDQVKAKLKYSKASNVVETEITDTNQKKTVFVHGTGTKTVKLDRPNDKGRIVLKSDTITKTQETDNLNNYASINNVGHGQDNSEANESKDHKQNLRSKLKNAKKRISKLKNKLSKTKKQLSQARRNITRLISQKRLLEKRVKNLSSEKTVRNTTLTNSSTEPNGTSTKIRKLRSENRKLRSRLNKLRTSLNQTSIRLSEAEEELKQVRTQKEQLNRTIRKLRSQNSEKTSNSRQGPGQKGSSPDEETLNQGARTSNNTDSGIPRDQKDNNSLNFVGLINQLFG